MMYQQIKFIKLSIVMLMSIVLIPQNGIARIEEEQCAEIQFLYVTDYAGKLFSQPIQPSQLAAGVAAGTLVPLDADRPVGGAAVLASYLETERKGNPHTILLAGAECHISSSRTFYRALNDFFHLEPVVLALRKLHLKARGLALHDFADETLVRLNEVIALAGKNKIDFPTRTQFTSVGIHDPAQEIEGVEKYRIFTIDGVKIAFIVVPDNRSTLNSVLDPSAPPSRQFYGSGPISVESNLDLSIAEANTARLQAQAAGAEIFVLTIFRGFNSSGGAATLAKTDGFDIVYFDNAAQTTAGFLPDKNGRSTFVVEPWSAGDEYSRFSVVFDKKQKKIVEFIGKGGSKIVPTTNVLPDFPVMRQIMVTTFADTRFPDLSMLQFLQPLDAKMHQKLDKKIGVVTRNLTLTPIGSDTIIYANLMADAVRAANETDIALISQRIAPDQPNLTPRLFIQYYQPETTQLNRTIPPLDIVKGDIGLSFYHEFFTHFISTTKSLAIDTLFQALEISVGLAANDLTKIIGISGFTYTFNLANPLGKKVASVALNNGKVYTRDPQTGLIPGGTDTISASADTFTLLFALNNIALYPLVQSTTWIPQGFDSMTCAVINHIKTIQVFNPDNPIYANRAIAV